VVDDGGFVYVADMRNGRIQKFDSDGTYVTEFGSFPTGQPWEPVMAVAVDNISNEVFAGDLNNHKVQVFSTDGTFLREWAIPDPHLPTGLAVDAQSNVFVSSEISRWIFKYTNAGALLTSWETVGLLPAGMTVSESGDLYVAVEVGVAKYSSNGQFIAQYGQAGSGDGQFDQAYCVALDADDNMIVSDRVDNSRVQKLRSDGVYLSQWPVFNYPLGVAVGPTGAIYVGTRGNEILRYEYTTPVHAESWGAVKSRYREAP
jgi:DNA-binding beta-propeller fold protein YncE